MRSIGFLRKANISTLAAEYERRSAVADSQLRTLKELPLDQTTARLKAASATLEAYARAEESMISMVRIFSPNAARALDEKLKHHLETSRGILQNDYQNDPKLRGLRDTSRRDLINRMIAQTLQFSKINKQIIDIAFVAVSETSKGRPPQDTIEWLESRLAEVDHGYVQLYRGAIDSLDPTNPDGPRHCAVSTRTLLLNVINKLGKGETRRDKLKSILGSEVETDMADALAESVARMNDTLSKGVHASIDFETASMCLRTAELVLQFVLSKQRR